MRERARIDDVGVRDVELLEKREARERPHVAQIGVRNRDPANQRERVVSEQRDEPVDRTAVVEAARALQRVDEAAPPRDRELAGVDRSREAVAEQRGAVRDGEQIARQPEVRSSDASRSTARSSAISSPRGSPRCWQESA